MRIQPTAAALNHLLAQNSWALPRLMRFAGKTVRFEVAPFIFAYAIQADGMLHSVAGDASADAVCVMALSLLPRLALHDEKAYADISTQGDAALLTEILFLARNLRWDAARDMGRITGNPAATRIAQTAREQGQKLYDAAAILPQIATDYFIEEHHLLADPQQVMAFMQQVDDMRDGVARLEQRIRQLQTGRGS